MNINTDIMSALLCESLGRHLTGEEFVWGIDKNTLGRGRYFNPKNILPAGKLPEGRHTFWVECGNIGKKVVEFFVG